jgi:hypothetical protein
MPLTPFPAREAHHHEMTCLSRYLTEHHPR